MLVDADGKPAEKVRSHISMQIRDGVLGEGARLPTERQLASDLRISRAAVREALTVLEVERLITRHVGRGTFVAPRPNLAGDMIAAVGTTGTSPSKLIEARLVMEPQIAELAVMNAREQDIRALRDFCDRLSMSLSSKEFEYFDRQFHLALVGATQNEVLVAIYEGLNATRDNAEWRKLKEHRFLDRPQRRHKVLEEHRLIVAAIEDRDPRGAREAMQAHLGQVRMNLLGF